jgi:hypothetical protein
VPVIRSIELPDFAEVEFQGFAEHTENPIAGFGNILRFRQYARDRQLHIGLFVHTVTFDSVGQHAFVGGGVHAALDDVVVRAVADHFQGLRCVMNAGEDDDRRIFRTGDQALQAANAVEIRDGYVNQENVEAILGDLEQGVGHSRGGAYGE